MLEGECTCTKRSEGEGVFELKKLAIASTEYKKRGIVFSLLVCKNENLDYL